MSGGVICSVCYDYTAHTVVFCDKTVANTMKLCLICRIQLYIVGKHSIYFDTQLSGRIQLHYDVMQWHMV